jgi:hypothetical protein
METLANTINESIHIFLPILGIGLGVMISVSLIDGTFKAIFRAFRGDSYPHHEIELEDEKLKREYTGDVEDKKPKRHVEPTYMLGDDGELIEVVMMEVIDEKPKRGGSYDG